MRGGLMVCGTASNAGKSSVVAGLCRVLARQGVRVAPFKAQNMALNSWVAAAGAEIGRAQGIQALAAGVEPEVAMNPILLKPTGERSSQVVVMGRPLEHLDAVAYHARKGELRGVVHEALADLRARYEVVICEGAGSPAEINLLDGDLVNLPLARDAGLAAIVVGDIDRGGVFASLYGTVALLPEELRALVGGFVINKFRGDPVLLGDGLAELERRSGTPTLGVLPWLHDVSLDAEDSLALSGPGPRASGPALADTLDIAVLRFAHVANFTDLDALAIEPGVRVRWVDDPAGLGDPDLVVLPGTKATVEDLDWLRRQGLDRALVEAHRRQSLVLGVCGGYQMLGTTIVDDIESGRGPLAGLGWLDATTTFAKDKVCQQRQGWALGQRVSGYEIHHGITVTASQPWVALDDSDGARGDGARGDGAGSVEAGVIGTNLHGIFEMDAFRAAFLRAAAARRGKRFVPAGVSFAAQREAQLDKLADVLAEHLDLAAIEKLIVDGPPG